jgi:hypothetical protein
MEKQILILASEMLKLASDTFANHGCNDLDEEILLKITDEKKLCDDIRTWNGDEECEWPERVKSIGDDTLMHYLSDKLKEESEKI